MLSRDSSLILPPLGDKMRALLLPSRLWIVRYCVSLLQCVGNGLLWKVAVS